MDEKDWIDAAHGALSHGIECLGMENRTPGAIITIDLETAGIGRYKVTIEKVRS